MINDVGELYGAGIAHGRIAAGLRLAGHEVRLANLRALQGEAREDGIPVETRLLDWIRRGDPDLVIMGNLHAAGGDTPLLAAIAEARPTFWVLHDFWLLTGRCAFTGGCPKYLPGCDAACPTPTEYPALAPELIAPAWAAKRALLAGESAPTLLANSASAADFARSAFAPAARRGRRSRRSASAFPSTSIARKTATPAASASACRWTAASSSSPPRR